MGHWRSQRNRQAAGAKRCMDDEPDAILQAGGMEGKEMLTGKANT